jgi:hypothetical protein
MERFEAEKTERMERKLLISDGGAAVTKIARSCSPFIRKTIYICPTIFCCSAAGTLT